VNFNSTEIGFKCLLVETSEDFGMSLADKETVIPMIHTTYPLFKKAEIVNVLGEYIGI
jgi:hypothetical protein